MILYGSGNIRAAIFKYALTLENKFMVEDYSVHLSIAVTLKIIKDVKSIILCLIIDDDIS